MNCRKCRQAEAYEEDSWCLGCSGLETLQTELGAAWKLAGFRAAAHDAIVSCVRQVRALRSLASSSYSADRSRAAVDNAQSKGLAAPPSPPKAPARSRSSLPAPPPPPSVKKQEESEESEDLEEESEEEEIGEKVTGACPKSDPTRKPPEPEVPPREPQDDREPLRRSSHHHRHREEERREPDWDKPKEKKSGKKHKRKREDRKRGNRGGAKHPRLYRTLDDPNIRVHRRPPGSFWDSERSFAGPGPRSSHR